MLPKIIPYENLIRVFKLENNHVYRLWKTKWVCVDSCRDTSYFGQQILVKGVREALTDKIGYHEAIIRHIVGKGSVGCGKTSRNKRCFHVYFDHDFSEALTSRAISLSLPVSTYIRELIQKDIQCQILRNINQLRYANSSSSETAELERQPPLPPLSPPGTSFASSISTTD